MANGFTKFKIIIPNFFTALSLVFGLISLQYTMDKNFVNSAWFIAASMVCDFLDGKLARLLHAQSKFGALFDTLSDFVAFGVVPGFLAYKVALFELGITGAVVTFFYILAGGYRLVRFTLAETNSTKKQPFVGLPIPAAAGIISSYIILNFFSWNSIKSANSLLALTFISGLLMVSKIEYLPLEKGKKFSREAKLFIVLALLSAVVAIRYPYYVFILWIVVYVLYGLIRHIVLSYKNRN
ncbi:MAG: CDP-diacylglycerol--serine O-phosphatidyltransferase [Candidatus Cloacimonadales bacterium]|nr:CDP-diacylglycerol--serine O-phosphatidyltransferase [Candidatus Cloacimonadales bacterium]